METKSSEKKIIKTYKWLDNSVVAVNHDGTEEIVANVAKFILDATPIEQWWKLAEDTLNAYGYEIGDRPKREYVRKQKFTLSPANQIVLVPKPSLAKSGPREYSLFRIRWKVNGKCIVRLGPSGFEVGCDKNAMLFTKEDVGMIANSSDFEAEEVKVFRSKRPMSLIRPRIDRGGRAKGPKKAAE